MALITSNFAPNSGAGAGSAASGSCGAPRVSLQLQHGFSTGTAAVGRLTCRARARTNARPSATCTASRADAGRNPNLYTDTHHAVLAYSCSRDYP